MTLRRNNSAFKKYREWGGENGKLKMWLEYQLYFNYWSYFPPLDSIVMYFHPCIKVSWQMHIPLLKEVHKYSLKKCSQWADTFPWELSVTGQRNIYVKMLIIILVCYWGKDSQIPVRLRIIPKVFYKCTLLVSTPG